jgi:ABC-type nitrate/sulfonate/bicarbonate transport system permease component
VNLSTIFQRARKKEFPETKIRAECPPWFNKLTGIVIAFVVLCVLWALTARAVNKAFLPYPMTVFASLIRLGKTGVLGKHVSASLHRLFWALLIGFFPAALLGLASGRSKRLNAVISSPYSSQIAPVKPAAWFCEPLKAVGL